MLKEEVMNSWNDLSSQIRSIKNKLKNCEAHAFAIAVSLKQKDWTSLHDSFSYNLRDYWITKGFSYQQVKKLIKKNLSPYDHSFAFWVKSEKKLKIDDLSKEELQRLKVEYQNSLPRERYT